MDYFLFFFWLILLSWLLTRIRFVTNTGLDKKIIIAVFICKVAAGVAAGWLFHAEPDSDSWIFHREALVEYKLLLTHPAEYFSNLFYTGYAHGYDGVLQTQNSYWNDLKDNLMIKFISVLDVFTAGNYYANVVLYNFLLFFGSIGLYKVFRQVYQSNALLTVVLVFLLPSVLFFGSTLHKDGLVMALTGVLVFNTWQWLHLGGSIRRALCIFFSLSVIFLFRSFVAMALLPALLCWGIAQKTSLSPIRVFGTIYLAAVILFFSIQLVLPAVNLRQYMVSRQADFLALPKGNTTIALDTLGTTPGSFAVVLPQAVEHGLFRPFITDIRLSKQLLPLALELLVYELLFLCWIFFRRRSFSINQPFTLFSLFFAISLCIIIGYTVPVIGAIVRYRSIYLPFLIAPLLFGIDTGKLVTIARIKK